MTKLKFLFLVFIAFAPTLAFSAPASRFGASPEQVRAAEARYASLENEFAGIARENNINEASLRAIARELGLRNPNVSADRFLIAIRAKAQEARALVAQISTLRERVSQLESAQLRDPAKLALDRAEAAFNQGRLEDAENELASLEVLRRSDIQSARDAWNAIIRRQSDIAALRGDLEKMDEILRAARRQREEWLARDAHKLWEDEIARAVHWYDNGDKLGVNSSLLRAIEILREDILPITSKTSSPIDWGATQNYLGNALWTLGRRENTNDNLRAAVIAYEEALTTRTRALVPLDWATTQNNLGNALSDLGDRENSPEKLIAAMNAYQSALLERTRVTAPLDWAMTQNNLGATLRSIGERENSIEKLQAAVAAYRAALQEWTRERIPNRWAGTQNNLGNVLKTLGERENSHELLKQSIDAYNQALLERTRESVPLQWAATQANMALAFHALAELENSSQRLRQSIEASNLSLLERTRERVPLDWAASQNGLGISLSLLGERESSLEILTSAKSAFDSALLEYTRDRVPLFWAYGINGRANTNRRIATLTRDCQLANSALADMQIARDILVSSGHAAFLEKSRIQIELAQSLIAQICN